MLDPVEWMKRKLFFSVLHLPLKCVTSGRVKYVRKDLLLDVHGSRVQLSPNTRQTPAGVQLELLCTTGHLTCEGETGNCPVYFISEAVLGLMSPQMSVEGSSINY